MVIEPELSGFHKMKLTVMKVFYSKQKTDIVQYRDYKSFVNEALLNDFLFFQINYNFETVSFKAFKEAYLKKHAPIREMYVRVDLAPFIFKRNKKRNHGKVTSKI